MIGDHVKMGQVIAHVCKILWLATHVTMVTNRCMCAVMLRQTIVKIERIGLSVLHSASKTSKSSLHTEDCMLGSGGIVGDVILFGFVT